VRTSRVRFVQVDFDREQVADRLLEAGFDPSRRTVVVWDGVTNYLQSEAVDAIAVWAGKLAVGSEFIFTYVHAGVLDGAVSFHGAAQMFAKSGAIRGALDVRAASGDHRRLSETVWPAPECEFERRRISLPGDGSGGAADAGI
jgi:O-methyltransferase involved in polyketide biosynthesis